MQKQKRTALLAKSRVALGVLLAALMLSAVFASSAGAAPAWKFNGTELEGTENDPRRGPEKRPHRVGVHNHLRQLPLPSGNLEQQRGRAKGTSPNLPLFNCYTDSTCTVEAIEAESFPWPAELVTTGGNNYMKVKGVNVWILYGGWFCPLWGVWAHVTGSAGGLLNNTTESATFSSSSFTATGTKLEALGAGVEWNGFFPAEAFTTHREESLTAS